MSAATILPLGPVESLPRKRFTRTEVLRMMDMGLFAGERYELLDGDLIDKMGQNPPHASSVQRVLKLLAAIFGLDRVRVQLPIEVGAGDRERSMPEPDLAALKADGDYESRHPGAKNWP